MKTKYPLVITIVIMVLLLAAVTAARAQDPVSKLWKPRDSEIKPVYTAEILAGVGLATQSGLPAQGLIATAADLKAILTALPGGSLKPDATYILHVVKWTGPDHRATLFDKWYHYDPAAPKPKALVDYSEAEWISRDVLAGQQDIFLVSLQLASDGRTGDEFAAMKKGVMSYTITIKKQPLQLLRDLSSLATMLGYPLASLGLGPNLASLDSTPPPDDHDAVTARVAFPPFPDHTQSSTITIAASGASVGGAAGTPATVDLHAASYVNEPATWLGLSMAVPVTSYSDLTVDQTNRTVVPKTVTRQNLAACLDFYVPALEPALRTKSFRPHPFIGFPLSGKVLQHSMIGVGAGYYGVEVYYAGVWDLENREPSGSKKTVWKPTYGIKISVDSAAKLLAKAAGK